MLAEYFLARFAFDLIVHRGAGTVSIDLIDLLGL